MGQPVPRVDIPAKVTGGAAYVQDMRLPGMVHARVVRPPSYGAQLTECDTAAVEKLPGVVKVVRDGNFLAVVAEKEFQAIKAMARAVGRGEMEGDARACRSRTICRACSPACRRRTRRSSSEQSGGRRPKDHRGDLYAALSGARLDRPVLRGRAIQSTAR